MTWREVETEQVVAIPTEDALDAASDEFCVRDLCVGGRWVFVLGSFKGRTGSLRCAVLALDAFTGTVCGTYETGYIKGDNGGGTLRCHPSGSRVSLGREFSILILDFNSGRFTERAALNSEQETEEGCFFGRDHILHLDEMEHEGLVLTHLDSGKGTVATEIIFDAVWRYAVSPKHPFAVILGERMNAPRILAFCNLPEMNSVYEVQLEDRVGPDAFVLHPTAPCLIVAHEDRLLQLRYGRPGTPQVIRREAGALRHLHGFDPSGRRLFSAPTYAERDGQLVSVVHTWDSVRDVLETLTLPHRVAKIAVLDQRTMVAVHGRSEHWRGLKLSRFRVPAAL